MHDDTSAWVQAFFSPKKEEKAKPCGLRLSERHMHDIPGVFRVCVCVMFCIFGEDIWWGEERWRGNDGGVLVDTVLCVKRIYDGLVGAVDRREWLMACSTVVA